MNIRKMVAWAASVMMLILVASGVIGTVGINDIRMGGGGAGDTLAGGIRHAGGYHSADTICDGALSRSRYPGEELAHGR